MNVLELALQLLVTIKATANMVLKIVESPLRFRDQ